MKVWEIACGRSGDKASTLDLTLVAKDAESYALLERAMTASAAEKLLRKAMPGSVRRYEVPKLNALKFVMTGALPGGVYASLHAGLHWQKAAIAVLLDADLDEVAREAAKQR